LVLRLLQGQRFVHACIVANNPAMSKTIYTCRECGGTNAKWLGKCPHCGAWNTLEEGIAEPSGPASKNNRFQSLAKSQPVATLSEIDAAEVARTPTGQEELDRVLGGGIADSERGIAAAHLPFIWDRFYRVDASRDRATSGTGLGLALSRRMVEGMGGTINATSQPSLGTTITVQLPTGV
jgi:Histidine kinase-, DNA gyrase B-, and HSP90-like ATPase/Rubredoxin metal binding domain